MESPFWSPDDPLGRRTAGSVANNSMVQSLAMNCLQQSRSEKVCDLWARVLAGEIRKARDVAVCPLTLCRTRAGGPRYDPGRAQRLILWPLPHSRLCRDAPPSGARLLCARRYWKLRSARDNGPHCVVETNCWGPRITFSLPARPHPAGSAGTKKCSWVTPTPA